TLHQEAFGHQANQRLLDKAGLLCNNLIEKPPLHNALERVSRPRISTQVGQDFARYLRNTWIVTGHRGVLWEARRLPACAVRIFSDFDSPFRTFPSHQGGMDSH